jgi:hypothetical protein
MKSRKKVSVLWFLTLITYERRRVKAFLLWRDLQILRKLNSRCSLWKRELLYLSSRISRTLVRCSSLSEISLPGESVSCQIQGESVGWWSNIILSHNTTGGFFRGSRYGTSTSCHSGADKSSRPLTGTGSRHVTSLTPDRGSTHTSLPPTRVQCPLCGYPSASFFLEGPGIGTDWFNPFLFRFNPFLFRRLGFFFLFDYRLRHCTHFDTSPPGSFGRNGIHGECAWPDVTDFGFLRDHWIIGPPFVDRKSLGTMSNTGDVGGWQKW